MREAEDIIIRAITWNIWLEKNAHIFYDKYFAYSSVIVKAIHMFLSWIAATPETRKVRQEGSTAIVKHSLEFLGQHIVSGNE